MDSFVLANPYCLSVFLLAFVFLILAYFFRDKVIFPILALLSSGVFALLAYLFQGSTSEILLLVLALLVGALLVYALPRKKA